MPLNSWTVIFGAPAGHLWTISTMAFFYAVFPLLLHRLRRVKPASIRSLALCLYAIQVSISSTTQYYVAL